MSVSNIVHGLWIKGGLSPLELLTIHTYIEQGYTFRLWVYDSHEHYPSLPGLEVHNAEEIIPKEMVFSYKHSNQFGHGKGSYAGFSDIFRYKLLYEQGGWWSDMDVTCIKRLDFKEPYVFRLSKDKESGVVGNIMHVPAGSTLMRLCYEQAVEQIDAENKDWMTPIRILNDNIRNLGLYHYVKKFSNDDSWPTVSQLVSGSIEIPKHWQIIHWMNEEFRRLEIPKNVFLEHSFLGMQLSRHNLGAPILDWKLAYWYRFKTSRLYYAILHFRRETLLSSIYYLGFNVFYAISDLYFVQIKPRFDLMAYLRKLLKRNVGYDK
jgi:hypothetical protein